DGAMPAFVRLELGQLCQQIARRQSRDEQLPGIDADGTMLARMVDLEDSVAESFGATETGGQTGSANVTDLGRGAGAVKIRGGLSDQAMAQQLNREPKPSGSITTWSSPLTWMCCSLCSRRSMRGDSRLRSERVAEQLSTSCCGDPRRCGLEGPGAAG